MWVIGGVKSFRQNDVWYSTDGKDWIQATANAQWVKRSDHSSLVFDSPAGEKALWVLGGFAAAQSNDVWYSTDGVDWTQATAGAQWSARQSHVSVLFESKMWVIGGCVPSCGATDALNDVWYSTDGTTWMQATANAQWGERASLASVVFNNRIWVFGGYNQAATYYNDVWYSTDGTDWTQAAANVQWGDRSNSGFTVYKNPSGEGQAMWLIGGYDGGEINEVWYSVDGVDWTQATGNAEWIKRADAAAFVFNNQMWILGGNDPTGAGRFNDVWKSEPAGTFYVNVAPSVSNNFDPSQGGIGQDSALSDSPNNPVAIGDTITFTVHWDDANIYYHPEKGDGISEFQPGQEDSSYVGDNWSVANKYSQWSVRYRHTSLVFNNRMWMIGGSDGNVGGGCAGVTECNDVWYSTDGIDWTQAVAAAQWSERTWHTSLVFNNRMWVIGGIDADASDCVGVTECNDVWYSTDGIDWTQATAAAQWSERYAFNQAGGCPAVTECNDVWYSTDGIDWTEATAAAQWSERNRHTSLVFDDKMWVIGGFDNNAPDCPGVTECNDVWYSTDGIDWTQAVAAAQWSERYSHTSLVYDNRMWVIGGFDNNQANGCPGTDYCNDVWYSTDGIDWTQAVVSAQWIQRRSHASLAFDNQMWVIGGYDGTIRYNDVWYTDIETVSVKKHICGTNEITNQASGGGCVSGEDFASSTAFGTTNPESFTYTATSTDISTQGYWAFVCDDRGASNSCVTNSATSTTVGVSWTRETFAGAQWTARDLHTSVVFTLANATTTRMWVIGGFGGSNRRNDVWSSTDGIEWSQATAAAQWPERVNHTSMVYDSLTGSGEAMWMIGGFTTAATDSVNDVWYSTDGIDWTQATAAAQWTKRNNLTSLEYNNQMWVIGGYDGTNYRNDVWYSTDGVDWTQATAAAQWARRSNHKSVVFSNRMWVVGGFDPSHFNDVWYSTDGTDWTQATANSQWESREDHTSLVYNNQMWIVGGRADTNACLGGNTWCNDVWYSTDGSDWTQSTSNAEWGQRSMHTSVVYGNQMWIIGGFDAEVSDQVSDVWKSEPAGTFYVNTRPEIQGGIDSKGGYTTASSTSDPPQLKDSPDPLNVASTVTFTMWWNDLNIFQRPEKGDGISEFQPGQEDSSAVGDNWSVKTTDAQWSERYGHSSVVFNNQMWVIGGLGTGTCSTLCVNDVWYSTDGIDWTRQTANAQWSERLSHTSLVFTPPSSVASSAAMWVIGGDTGSLHNDVWYSTDGTDWTQSTANAQWAARGEHTSLVFDSKMWVIGASSTVFLNDVWYSTDGTDWTQQTTNAQWSARDTHTSLVFDSKMWVIGGGTNDVWFSTDGADWTQATAQAQWEARFYQTSLVFNDQMWMIGGTSGPELNDVWYSTDGADWTQAKANAQWEERYGHSSVVFNNQMWVMGGIAGLTENDVWYSDIETVSVKAHVCKTNAVINAVSGGGCEAGQEWVSASSSAFGATNPQELTYTTAAGDVGANEYWVFVCDDRGLSNSCSLASAGKEWTESTSNAQWGARGNHTSLVFNSQMWVIGGATSSGRFNDIWYSGDGIGWTRGTANAQFASRDDHTSLVFTPPSYIASGTVQWVMGGFDGTNRLNDVWYSTDGTDWTQSTANAQWAGRNEYTSLVFNDGTNKMWVIGGNTGSKQNDIWYSTDGTDWTQATANAQWEIRGKHASVVFSVSGESRMWVIGGAAVSELKNDVWYSTDGTDWTQATGSGQWIQRESPMSVVFGEKMWVIGGLDLVVSEYNNVWYSTDGIDWTEETASAQWEARSDHTSLVHTVNSQERMWVIGGFDETLNGRNDVWYTALNTGTFTVNAAEGGGGISISGTCDQYDQDTDCVVDGSENLRVAVNAALQTGASTTTFAGAWTISNVTVSSGDTITVFIDVATNQDEAVAVTEYDGSDNITGMKLFERHLTIGSDDTGVSITNSDLDKYTTVEEGDTDVFHTVTASSVTIDNANSFTDEELFVLAGNTYAPDGNINTHDLEIESSTGIFTLGANTIRVEGSWDNNATFNSNTGTVIFTATSTTETIDSTGASTTAFNNLTLGETSGSATFTLTTNLNVDGNYLLDFGIMVAGSSLVDIEGNVTINSGGIFQASRTATTLVAGDWVNAGTFQHGLGTITFDAGDTGNDIDQGTSATGVGDIWTEATSNAQWNVRRDHTSLVFTPPQYVASTTVMWVSGGVSGGPSTFWNDVWYSTDGTDWTQAAANAQWTGRYIHSSAIYADAGTDKMWVIGGHTGSVYLNDVWYSTDGIDWTQATERAAWGARCCNFTLVFDASNQNRLWMIGGNVGGTRQNDVWYSTDGQDWTQATANTQWEGRSSAAGLLFTPSSYVASTTVMWLAGGLTTGPPTVAQNDVWYSTDGTDWTRATANAQWGGRQNHTILLFNNQMWVTGGVSSTLYFNDVWYTTDGIDWTRQVANASWLERSTHTSVVFNNQMWVMGGEDGAANTQNSVWYSGITNAFYDTRFNNATGSWSASASTMYVEGDLTLDNGTIDSTAGTANIEARGNVEGSSGLFNLSSGTFIHNIITDKNFGTTSTATNWTLNNLTFQSSDNAESTSTFALGGTGTINVSANLIC